jgi:hypothetical protein
MQSLDALTTVICLATCGVLAFHGDYAVALGWGAAFIANLRVVAYQQSEKDRHETDNSKND